MLEVSMAWRLRTALHSQLRCSLRCRLLGVRRGDELELIFASFGGQSPNQDRRGQFARGSSAFGIGKRLPVEGLGARANATAIFLFNAGSCRTLSSVNIIRTRAKSVSNNL